MTMYYNNIEVIDMAKSYIQVRADENDKEMASEILDKLGTNLSAVINMLLKQIIMTKSIPFAVKLNNNIYSEEDIISEIDATLAMENMKLSTDDIALLNAYRSDKSSAEEIRNKLIANYKQEKIHE